MAFARKELRDYGYPTVREAVREAWKLAVAVFLGVLLVLVAVVAVSALVIVQRGDDEGLSASDRARVEATLEAELGRPVDAVDTHELADEHFRTCVHRRCYYVDTDSPDVVRDPSSEPNP